MEKKEYFDGDFIILVIFERENGERENIWTNDGLHSLNPENYKNMTDEEVVEHLKENPKPCTQCNTPLEGKKCFWHFTVCLCDSCANVYKKEHSGNCNICNKPRWACHC